MMKTHKYIKRLTYLIGGLLLSTTMTCTIAAANTYTVKKGDTIGGISKRYNISENILMTVNGLNSTNINEGQVLNIPDMSSKYTHVVKDGDTLTSVANRFGVTPVALAKENKLSNSDFIFVGQVLNIPRTAKPAAVVTVSPDSGNQNKKPEVDSIAQTINQKSQQGKKYRVQYGESLTSISQKFNVPVNALLAANNMKYNDVLHFGKLITIPEKSSSKNKSTTSVSNTQNSVNYIVKRGDTLTGLQNRFHVDFRDIAKANNMQPYEQLSIGQKLIIPTSNLMQTTNEEY